jgi:hypothetical protein
MSVQGTDICRVYNYYDNHAYGYKQSRILIGLVGIGLVWMGISLGVICQIVRRHWFKIYHES